MVAHTRAMDAMAGFYFKQGAVAGALDEGLISIEKLIFLPFKINAGVWTAVDECMKFTIFMNHKNIEHLVVMIKLECFTAGVRNI